MKIENGSPVILKDSEGLEEHGLKKGTKGYANSVIELPGEGTFVFFMPETERQSYVINLERLEIDKERLEGGEDYPMLN